MNTSVSVIFINHTDFKFLKLLKRGFRHCFALIRNGKKTFVVDPLMNNLCLFELTPKQFEKLQAELRAQKATVVDAVAIPAGKDFIFGFYSCVAVIKRLLGVHKPFVLTPYQLYKYLINQTKE
ncbi:MAG: hypothetical protein GC136_00010 [Alphaproteobacteria bacterium]|nr:hypothetical protein [Alphaproteobacteria bacterium]